MDTDEKRNKVEGNQKSDGGARGRNTLLDEEQNRVLGQLPQTMDKPEKEMKPKLAFENEKTEVKDFSEVGDDKTVKEKRHRQSKKSYGNTNAEELQTKLGNWNTYLQGWHSRNCL